MRAQRSARGVLIVYVAGLIIVFGSQGFRSTGERTLPNVLLFGSMILVLACETELTIRQQRSMSQARKQASAVLTRGTGETRNVLPSDDYLLQLSRFDQWTARYKLRWFDGTVPSSRSAQP
ncbi:hypothetical protein DEI93_07725 [Curtobacterium sp. MCBD17_035]|uniref:hypothetical protein n=1 Tax=Curtobacterium sp. MCBD17_035 TaxID=2175673 RepID=UPI000DA83BC7|nr:hypothetical protein [Curtobacterium sp. MCBD17_035]WIB68907.1 hypothetical protein DEI93_07725 [Curtobacterium sp. MCBD17_035]